MNRKPRSAKFKAQVAFEALKNQKTINELATEYQVHPNQTCLPACALRAGKRATHRQKGEPYREQKCYPP